MSASDAELKEYYKQIDWSTSALYEAALTGSGLRGEDKLDMYTQVEAEHHASLLKKSNSDEDLSLSDVFSKALFTLGVLMQSLLQGKVFQQLSS